MGGKTNKDGSVAGGGGGAGPEPTPGKRTRTETTHENFGKPKPLPKPGFMDDDLLQGVLDRSDAAKRDDYDDSEDESQKATRYQDFAHLPGDLKSMLQKSFDWPERWFTALSARSRAVLVNVYNRLHTHGLWSHVTKVRGVKDQPEQYWDGPLDVGVAVDGNSGGINFVSKGADALMKAMIDTRKFGRDQWYVALLHPGQKSFRESGNSDSLHVSVGPGDFFDAHLDAESPVEAPNKDGSTNLDGAGSIRHQTREVIAEITNKFFPGIRISPGSHSDDFVHGGESPHSPTGPERIEDDYSWGSVSINWRFGADKKSDRPGPNANHQPPKDTAEVSGDLMASAASAALAAIGKNGLTPKGKDAGEYADPEEVGRWVAMKLQKAARDDVHHIVVDLGDKYRKLGATDERQVRINMGKLGKAVHKVMGDPVARVHDLRLMLDEVETLRISAHD